ncbi:hypothetical protein AB0I81_40350 [Nonomuraea sp. NPDC050404]|uniref:hypothetical protein n=1 Tax=Nonomuraea sp. NPDC050404 TaxID=3155783 RepID=UPI0034043335
MSDRCEHRAETRRDVPGYHGPAVLIPREQHGEYPVHIHLWHRTDTDYASLGGPDLEPIMHTHGWTAEAEGKLPVAPYDEYTVRFPDGREAKAGLNCYHRTSERPDQWSGHLTGAGRTPA